MEIISLFYKASGLFVSINKSRFFPYKLDKVTLDGINFIFPYKTCELENRFKYLGYILKPNDYKVHDWHWLLEKFEKRIKKWTCRLLSIGGRLTLIKVVLINIPIYWSSLL